MIGKTAKYCSVSDIRRLLSLLMPNLAAHWDRPLKDYAVAVYNVERFCSACSVRRRSMELLARRVELAAQNAGYSLIDAQSASRQLLMSPVLQTGPHCLLLTEPDAFYTHLFGLLGLMAHNYEWYITYHTSTVSFSEAAKKGPGWISLEGEVLNVFGLPRSQMDSFSVCGSNRPYRFAFSNSKGIHAPNPSASQLLAELPAIEFPTAAAAIAAANLRLWRTRISRSISLLQLDDFDIADLVADHLDDAGSWMSQNFIGDGTFARSILDEIDHLNSGPWQGWVRRTTDLFWQLEKGRIVPLRLQKGCLRSAGPSNFSVSFQPYSIAVALRERAIVPSLYTVFLVTSILPGVRVLGGCRQAIYYPLMRYLTAAGLERMGGCDLLKELSSDKRLGLWGHRVLKPTNGTPIEEVKILNGPASPLQGYASMPLTQSGGNFASFTRDPDWAKLAQYIDNDFAVSTFREWRWP